MQRTLTWSLFFTAVAVCNASPTRAEAEHPAVASVDLSGRSPQQIYAAACAACHGHDGTGVSASQTGLEEPLPDFTDCQFAPREPDADWVSVATGGGPARAFSRRMPAFGDALDGATLQRAVDHIRTFCDEPDWPRGELNMPRAMYTEKAFPEDEAVFLVGVGTGEDERSARSRIIYEQRFGSRTQIEIVVPFQTRLDGEGDDEAWLGGLGDLAFGIKRVLIASHESGTAFSFTAEMVTPTGNRKRGFGKGTFVFEPFFTFGQLLPADSFVQAMVGAELPFDEALAENEVFARTVLGTTFGFGQYNRAFSPMVEVLMARELESGAEMHWDVVPQFQVALNRRQHILLNLAARFPLDDTPRPSEVVVYVLWDWFDGGFFDGWGEEG